MKRGRRSREENKHGVDGVDVHEQQGLQEELQELLSTSTHTKRRLQRKSRVLLATENQQSGNRMPKASLKQRMQQRQQRLLTSTDPTKLDDSSSDTEDSADDDDETGGRAPPRTRRRVLVDDDDDEMPGSSEDDADGDSGDDESLGSFIDEQEDVGAREQLHTLRNAGAPRSNLEYWHPRWLEYLACCIADPGYAMAVAKNAEHAEHYRNAMRAVEEQAWRGIVDSYSFAWRSAQPGFLRALQSYPVLRRQDMGRDTHPIEALLRSDKCAACNRKHQKATCMLELLGPAGDDLWRHGMTASVQMQQDLAVDEDSSRSDYEEDEDDAAAAIKTPSTIAKHDPISGAVLSPSNRQLGAEQVWRVGRFCASRASVYHSLYHYKRHVAYILARRLRQYREQHGDDDRNAAVDAVLKDSIFTSGLRLALNVLCGAAQTLQTKQAEGAQWRGQYKGIDGKVKQAAREMGLQCLATTDTDDWVAAARAGAGVDENDGDKNEAYRKTAEEEEEQEEEDEEQEEEEEEQEEEEEEQQPRRWLRRRSKTMMSSDDEESGGGPQDAGEPMRRPLVLVSDDDL